MAVFYKAEKTTIINFANKIGFDISDFSARRLLTEEQNIEIISLYRFCTSTELANRYHCSPSLIGKIWMENDCKNKEYARQYYSNFQYFKEIDSKDKAYFLGFIAADGCVFDRYNNRQQKLLSIGIHKKDEEVLIKFLYYLKSNNPINYTQSKITPIVSIQIVSNELCNYLSKYNIVPNKTWTYFPINIPNEFWWHFLRGFFDGDGSVGWEDDWLPHRNHISMAGNQKLIQTISDFLNDNNIKHGVYEDKREKYTNRFYNLSINSKANKIIFIERLYKDCNDLYLNRKKIKCDSFIEKCRSMQ